MRLEGNGSHGQGSKLPAPGAVVAKGLILLSPSLYQKPFFLSLKKDSTCNTLNHRPRPHILTWSRIPAPSLGLARA